MNSLVSFDWLKQYVDLKGVTPEEFARRISLSGPAVEKIVPLGKDLDKVVVGRIKAIDKHPNADKLRLVTVDIGEKGTPLKVVCGGTNLIDGQYVALAKIGARIKWHGTGDLVALEPAEIRGISSEGMICAANEIGLEGAFPHADREILDLGKELGWEVGKTGVPKPGTPLADALGLSTDLIMDVEVTSNRVDAMGMVGMAREASAIMGKKFIWKNPALSKTKGGAKKSDFVKVKISAKKQCPRYVASRINGVQVGPSPWWLKRRLLSAGHTPINNIVDISNFVMLELAQPTHVFDATTLEGGIDVRLAQTGDSIRALDGKTYELDDSILVIADKDKPVAIAGVMGGQDTGVMSNTKDVVIECASFDPVVVRRGARKLNIQTDAQLRFEKGLSSESPTEAMARMIELILEIAGGELVGGITDVRTSKYKPATFSITTDEVNALMGTRVPQSQMCDVLRRLGFQISTSGKRIKAKVPYWRDHDIEDGRDLVEEIARVHGYANIPPTIPFGLAPRSQAPDLVWERRARDISKGAGMTELYTYSFVSEDLIRKAGYDPKGMLHVQNPLTVDFEVMRTTMLPSLLQAASENVERFPELRLFEVSNVYYPKSEGWTDLPDEQLELAALFAGMKEPWRQAKGYVEHVLSEMGIKDVSWRRLQSDTFWHPGRTVQAFHQGNLMATVGEVSPKIAGNFKLEGPVALVDMPIGSVVKHAKTSRSYVSIPAFPEAKRDLAVIVDWRTEYDDLAREIERTDQLVTSVEWFDTYRGQNLPSDKKSVAMHISFASPDRTLDSAEVDGMMEKIALKLKEKFKAEIRQ